MMTREPLPWRAILGLILAFGLLATACSGDDDADDTSADTEADAGDATEEEAPAEEAEEEEAPAEEEEPEATEEEEEEAEEAEEEAEPVEVPEGALPIGLGEWFVDAPEGITAGTLTFAVSNSGENPHAFAIVRGDSYEDLPQKTNGAVDLDAVGDDFLGTTDNLETGESAVIDFDLEAGNYVFFCPIEFGPNSHAAAGQVLSVTVG